jgi:hypothetical protein
MKKSVRFAICFFCLAINACGVFSQETKVKEKKIALLEITDQKVITFESDSIQMKFSYNEVLKLLKEDLKGNRSRVEEYDSKKILLDSLLRQSVKVKIEAFTLEKAHDYVQVAMLSVSNKLLKQGHAQITLNGDRLKQIKFVFINGPYNSQSVSYYHNDKLFFHYGLGLGE